MFQVQIPIGGLPINLVLLSDGTLVFVRTAAFKPIFDQPDEGVSAVFTEEGFTFDSCEYGKEDFFYNTVYPYKSIPIMRDWLIKQNLMEPNVVMGF